MRENGLKVVLTSAYPKRIGHKIVKDLNLEFISKNIFLPEKLDDLSSFDQDNKNYNFESSPKSEGVVIKINQ